MYKDLIVWTLLFYLIQCICFSIHSDRFKVLATFIKDLFPKEEKETYYVPYGTDSFGKTIWTGGLLYETYKEVRDDLRRARKLSTRQRTRPNSFLISKLIF